MSLSPTTTEFLSSPFCFYITSLQPAWGYSKKQNQKKKKQTSSASLLLTAESLQYMQYFMYCRSSMYSTKKKKKPQKHLTPCSVSAALLRFGSSFIYGDLLFKGCWNIHWPTRSADQAGCVEITCWALDPLIWTAIWSSHVGTIF